MTAANLTALSRYKQTLNVMGPIAKKLAKMVKLSNNRYINKHGDAYNRMAKRETMTHAQLNKLRTQAFNKNPKHLVKYAIPYVGPDRPNNALMKKLKLKNSNIFRAGRNWNGYTTTAQKKVYYNKNGELYYIRLNGVKHKLTAALQPEYVVDPDSRNLRQLKRLAGQVNPNFPRSAIPPASPPPRRSSPNLLENIMTQIYTGGRGANVNATRYTNLEKNVLAKRLSGSINYFKQQRNTKKAEAAQHREALRAPGLTNAQKQQLRNRAAAANERVGYFDDAVLSYTRGLRAVKPLTGVVTPRARAMPNTPNRYTPAGANVTENLAYANLVRPHLVVKTPGIGTIYLNPNTFRGLVKNSARVNVAPANVRNWLRMARRNFPNEKLFRHPLAPKNVTASHIRFSRA